MRVRVRVFTLLAASTLVVGGLSSLSPAASAGRGPSAAGRGAVFGGTHPNGLGTVLYAQQGNDSGVGIVSQDFGDPGFDIYDAQGADDFTVPSGETWTVKIVGISGVYFSGSGPAPAVNVVFYEDAGGTPGSVISSQSKTTGSRGPAGDVKLSTWVTLTSGTYWFSFQAIMDFSLGGEFGWETTNDLNGSPAVWVNPGDGFVTGCTTYQNMQNCIGPLGEGPDFMFSLKGVSQPVGS